MVFFFLRPYVGCLLSFAANDSIFFVWKPSSLTNSDEMVYCIMDVPMFWKVYICLHIPSSNRKQLLFLVQSIARLNCPRFDSSFWSSTGVGGGVYSKKCYTGRLRPEVKLLTLLYTIFFRKGTPFVYLLNSRPFFNTRTSFSHDKVKSLCHK